MKVLITGANGQLGLSIRKNAEAFPSLEIDYTDIEELDITNAKELNLFFNDRSYDYVVNCAAYTAVDKAEKEQEKAFLINTTAVEHLAKLSVKHGFYLLHISTDFIFDGKKSRPYVESDHPGPLSVYSATKAKAEQMILDHAKKAMILRTSWLYSEFGNNFAKTILRLSGERKELKIVSDQIGTPTYAGDIAEAILLLLSKNSLPDNVSIYHYSNQGVASWYDFAKAITTLSQIHCRIIPIPTEDYPLPAKRPPFSVLSKDKFTNDFDIEIPYWRDSLEICIKLLSQHQ